MRASSLAFFSRSTLTTASGARVTKFWLASFAFCPASCFSALASSFWMRYFSFSRSTSSAMGMNMRALSVMTETMPSVFSGAAAETLTSLA